MTLEEQLVRRKYAVRILDSAASLFDGWLMRSNLLSCIALREKAKALIAHDRIMIGDRR